MSERSSADQVKSGLAYTVHRVNDRPPVQLDDFVATPLVAVTVRSGDEEIGIRGESRRDGDAVILYEKDGDGVGKDVRTWRVREHAGGFEAAERSVF